MAKVISITAHRIDITNQVPPQSISLDLTGDVTIKTLSVDRKAQLADLGLPTPAITEVIVDKNKPKQTIYFVSETETVLKNALNA